MASPSFGLVVEGFYDEQIFRRLIPRLIPGANLALEIRPCGGSRLWRKFPGFLEELGRCRAGEPVGKAMVIVDSDRGDARQIETELSAAAAGKVFRFPRGVQFCAVVQEIEAWLLADEKAITRVAQQRGIGGRTAPPTQGTIEEIADPKDRLRTVLSACSLPYNPAVCGDLAAEADLDVVRHRCPSFRRFEQKLDDC